MVFMISTRPRAVCVPYHPAAAKTLGMTTVLIAGHTSAEEGRRADGFVADATVGAVTEAEVRAQLPGLWR